MNLNFPQLGINISKLLLWMLFGIQVTINYYEHGPMHCHKLKAPKIKQNENRLHTTTKHIFRDRQRIGFQRRLEKHPLFKCFYKSMIFRGRYRKTPGNQFLDAGQLADHLYGIISRGCQQASLPLEIKIDHKKQQKQS